MPATKSLKQAAFAANKLAGHVNTHALKKTCSKTVKGAKRSILKHVMNQVDTYRLEELQAIEKRRRAILQLVEQPFWKIILHLDGTVLQQMTHDMLFWITAILYAGIRFQARFGKLPTYLSTLGSGNIAALGGFISFILVFYVNQTHKRYFDLYSNSMAVKGRIFDVAALAKTTFGSDQAAARRLVRYLNAAHAAGYVGLSDTYPSGSFFAHVNSTCGLLTRREMTRMNVINMDKGGCAHRELIVWCLKEINDAKLRARNDPNSPFDSELINMLREKVLAVQAAMGQIYSAQDLPIPFYYVHFIVILTAMYLPLFAIAAGLKAGTGAHVHWTADVVAGLVVMLQALFINGLRVLGQKMSDPYGDDLVDLSVMFYVHFTWINSNRILEARLPAPEDDTPDLIEEQMIAARSNSLGAAWETETTCASTSSISSSCRSADDLRTADDMAAMAAMLTPLQSGRMVVVLDEEDVSALPV